MESEEWRVEQKGSAFPLYFLYIKKAELKITPLSTLQTPLLFRFKEFHKFVISSFCKTVFFEGVNIVHFGNKDNIML